MHGEISEQRKEDIMTRCTHSEAADLHTQAANAHLAAEHESLSGDPKSAAELSVVADEFAVKAARLSRDIMQEAPPASMGELKFEEDATPAREEKPSI